MRSKKKKMQEQKKKESNTNEMSVRNEHVVQDNRIHMVDTSVCVGNMGQNQGQKQDETEKKEDAQSQVDSQVQLHKENQEHGITGQSVSGTIHMIPNALSNATSVSYPTSVKTLSGHVSIISSNRLLVVEHVEASARMLKVALTRAKFVVDAASNGNDMWMKLCPSGTFLNSYRVILFNMQDSTMMEFVKQIRASEKEEKALLFGMGPSSKMKVDDLKPWIDAGMDGYIYAGSIIAKEVQQFIAKKDKDPSTFLITN